MIVLINFYCFSHSVLTCTSGGITVEYNKWGNKSPRVIRSCSVIALVIYFAGILTINHEQWRILLSLNNKLSVTITSKTSGKPLGPPLHDQLLSLLVISVVIWDMAPYIQCPAKPIFTSPWSMPIFIPLSRKLRMSTEKKALNIYNCYFEEQT